MLLSPFKCYPDISSHATNLPKSEFTQLEILQKFVSKFQLFLSVLSDPQPLRVQHFNVKAGSLSTPHPPPTPTHLSSLPCQSPSSLVNPNKQNVKLKHCVFEAVTWQFVPCHHLNLKQSAYLTEVYSEKELPKPPSWFVRASGWVCLGKLPCTLNVLLLIPSRFQ